MKILVDGDACPVIEEIGQIASQYEIPVEVVTSWAHYSDKPHSPHITYHYVDSDNQMADYKLASMMKQGDILITQDYGLAFMTYEKGQVLHHTGMVFSNENMPCLINQRHIHRLERDKYRTYHNIPKFTAKDRKKFIFSLRQLIEKHINI